MRKTFVDNLMKLTESDSDIILFTDDLGYSFLEPFQERFPKQFINCGIIEEAMTGIAAGLSQEGKKVYIYGTIPFIIMRNYEFIRNDICYNKNKVVFIGISHSGFLGFSHNCASNEDIKILKHLPNLDIYIPKTKKEVNKIMKIAYNSNNASYIRI